MRKTKYRATVRLRESKGGHVVVGTIEDDGLQDLWLLTQHDGATSWVSSLDTFLKREPLTRYAVDVLIAGRKPFKFEVDAIDAWHARTLAMHTYLASARYARDGSLAGQGVDYDVREI